MEKLKVLNKATIFSNGAKCMSVLKVFGEEPILNINGYLALVKQANE
jgi:hypothetical protein